MYAELRELLYDAEEHYLKSEEIDKLRQNVESLKERLAIYKELRNREIDIFQAIANQLEKELDPTEVQQLPELIVHWAKIVRYVAMGMLLNSNEFIQRRILEWITPVRQAHNRVSLDEQVYKLLYSELKNLLPEQQWQIWQPFIVQVEQTMLRANETEVA
ncbi:MAG: phycobilisome protein [Gloeocapsa sp. DLM2.Bin57]|nr:MAG: phycobilisome protein [Gloeocapsa sp. DLM2.Bin57]